MKIMALMVGIVMLTVTVIDLLWTTLRVEDRAGPISRKVSLSIWLIFRHISSRQKKMMSWVGPITLMATLMVWVTLMWLGWALVFASDPQSIADPSDYAPIKWYEYLYFTGYALFTLGNGDYSPKEGVWQIMTTLISGGGMLFLTLGASYILAIVDGVVKMRSFASSVNEVLADPNDFVELVYDPRCDCDQDIFLVNLANDLGYIALQHKAYPLLHFYHSMDAQESMSLAIVLLDETLSILEYGVVEESHLNPIFIANIHSSIVKYLDTANFSKKSPLIAAPKLPDLEPLREKNIAVVSQQEFGKRMAPSANRRQKLAQLIAANGREWPLNK